MTERALWTAAEAATATDGNTPKGWSASGVSIDSRSLQPGDLFAALKGPNFDGHDFVAAAFEAGAAAAMVNDDLEGPPTDKPWLRVDDTLKALWGLGAAARARRGLRRFRAGHEPSGRDRPVVATRPTRRRGHHQRRTGAHRVL